MAFGLNTEGSTSSELADDRFIAKVGRLIGRPLTFDEEEIAIAVRDQGGYSAEEAAEEVCANAAA